jgi:hypothetical protein
MNPAGADPDAVVLFDTFFIREDVAVAGFFTGTGEDFVGAVTTGVFGAN